MAISIHQLQTNVHLPAVDFTMVLFPSDLGGATSSRTQLTALPVTQTAGTVWAQPTLSVSRVAIRIFIC
jgi:hypothetical protein